MILNSPQHAFIGLWASGDPERIRRHWLRGGKVLRPVSDPFTVPDDLEPGDRLRAYRLAADTDATFTGDAMNRRSLSVADALALGPCWDEPFRTLSPLGLALARAPAPTTPELTVRSFKLPVGEDRDLERLARIEGRDVSAVLRELVAAWLGSRR